MCSVRFFLLDTLPILTLHLMKALETFQDFAYHCQYANLNDTLKDYLQALEVPYPKAMTPTEDDYMSEPLLQAVIWPFFRTLSREVGVNPTPFTW